MTQPLSSARVTALYNRYHDGGDNKALIADLISDLRSHEVDFNLEKAPPAEIVSLREHLWLLENSQITDAQQRLDIVEVLFPLAMKTRGVKGNIARSSHEGNDVLLCFAHAMRMYAAMVPLERYTSLLHFLGINESFQTMNIALQSLITILTPASPSSPDAEVMSKMNHIIVGFRRVISTDAMIRACVANALVVSSLLSPETVEGLAKLVVNLNSTSIRQLVGSRWVEIGHTRADARFRDAVTTIGYR